MIELQRNPPESPHLLFKSKAAEAFFERNYPLQSSGEAQKKLTDEVSNLLRQWSESLNPNSDFKNPAGFDVMWVGVKDWQELKSQTSCSQCGSPVKYSQSHCSNCLTAKPHFILTVQETETSIQHLEDVIQDNATLPTVLPEGFKYDLVGARRLSELNRYRNCLYCGAPVLITFPACSHCGMSKPHLKLVKPQGDSSDVVWQTNPWQTISGRRQLAAAYFNDREVDVKADFAIGVCRAEKIFLQEGASVVAGNAIQITLEDKASAKELAAKYLDLGKDATIGTVTVYDGGILKMDASTKIGELFLGENVQVEITGILKPGILQKIREFFSAFKPSGRRNHVSCKMPNGMEVIEQKG